MLPPITFYNEIFYALFACMFLMLAISAAPGYQRGLMEKQSLLLAGVPLVSALSAFMFLLAPHVHQGLLTVAIVCFIAAMLGAGLLLRTWRQLPCRRLSQALVLLLVLTGALFEHWRLHGSYQQRNYLVLGWLLASGLWLATQSWRIHQLRPSFFLKALFLALLGWMVIVALRLVWVGLSETSPSFLYEEPMHLMVMRFLASAFHLFIAIFLLAHASERLNWLGSALRDAKEKAEGENTELAQLVRERDHMLMINSRFSSVSSLAVFNSAIVHEISQPLSALTLVLQEAQWHAQEKDKDGVVDGALSHSLRLVEKIVQMNQSLRQLMLEQKLDLQALDVGASLREILPILRNEARHRGIQLQAPQTWQGAQAVLEVRAHKVLLERILYNLVANAMDALAAHSPTSGQPLIELAWTQSLRQGQAGVAITVSDNGPGFSERMLAHEWLQFQSSKPKGMGVGLVLGRAILNTWNGDLVLRNPPTGGACVDLWIPLQKPCALGA
jgi:C4-dicarboxylate-specific signal transduction histidine kinase